jgi:hypothetical protein
MLVSKTLLTDFKEITFLKEYRFFKGLFKISIFILVVPLARYVVVALISAVIQQLASLNKMKHTIPIIVIKMPL